MKNYAIPSIKVGYFDSLKGYKLKIVGIYLIKMTKNKSRFEKVDCVLITRPRVDVIITLCIFL
tara:strand:+ start:902 stop:1090 length:189 start_codon:yes stop_codon:yes gene_type:complete